jgi:AcrR family transcriptional regulator
MSQELESTSGSGVLTPSVPQDISARAQQQRILDAMAKSCAEKTFSATTIADIVGYASISRATFYKHFTNKRECFDAAMRSFIAELEEVAIEAQSDAASRPDAIRRAIAAMLEWLAAKPAYANLVLIDAPIVEPGVVMVHRELAIDGLKSQWEADKGGKRAGADARIAFGRAHLLVADYLAAGRAKKLPDLLPEIVYVALLAFVGHEEALAQVELVR